MYAELPVECVTHGRYTKTSSTNNSMILSGDHCEESPKWGTMAHGLGRSHPTHLLKEKENCHHAKHSGKHRKAIVP